MTELRNAQLTLISSFRLLPLSSRWVSEVAMLRLSESEWAIWFTPFAVSPHWDNDSLHSPLEIFAIGPARCTAPVVIVGM